MQIIRAMALCTILEFATATIWYVIYGSGVTGLVNEGVASTLPASFTKYYLFNNVYNAGYYGLIGVMVGLIPALFLYSVKKESLETQMRYY